jgi:Holliday junction DNA helicase RuvA
VIGSLRGAMLHRGADEVLVEVGGIGHRVAVSPTTAVSLGDVGDEVFVHVHHHQREDAQTLYGFASRDERDCFEALLGAHGVGPALALAILSVHDPRSLARLLAEDDIGALCLVPGVGKKTATRLLVELKSRLSVPDLGASDTVLAAATDGTRSSRTDVREALAGLGYTLDEIRSAVNDLPDDGDPALLLREALGRLSAAR